MSGGGERITRLVSLLDNRRSKETRKPFDLELNSSLPPGLEVEDDGWGTKSTNNQTLAEKYEGMSILALLGEGLITPEEARLLALKRSDPSLGAQEKLAATQDGNRGARQAEDTQIGPVRRPGVLKRRMNEVKHLGNKA